MSLPVSQAHRSADLPSSLNKKLIAYVTAASAGLSMVTFPQTADAEVVYTPANTPLLVNTPVPLDLNNDGVIDFTLSDHYSFTGSATSCFIPCVTHAVLKVSPAQAGNGAWALSSAVFSHLHLPARPKNKPTKKTEVVVPAPWGAYVAKERRFEDTPLPMDYFRQYVSFSGRYSTQSVGPWGKNKRFAGTYAGFRFMIDGETHYGWARIEVHSDRTKITATLTGYAYETVPNRGIVTGLTHGPDESSSNASDTTDPASLGRLAEGASGMAAWRTTPASR